MVAKHKHKCKGMHTVPQSNVVPETPFRLIFFSHILTAGNSCLQSTKKSLCLFKFLSFCYQVLPIRSPGLQRARCKSVVSFAISPMAYAIPPGTLQVSCLLCHFPHGLCYPMTERALEVCQRQIHFDVKVERSKSCG